MIRSPAELGRLGWLGPPVEVCPETELIAIEASATVCDDAFQIGEGLEVLVGERLIQNRPEVLSRLKLGRVRGQVGEPGTTRFGSVCQPALSSPSTMMRSRPAPASRANSASSAAKNGFETPFEMYQKVSPEVGCTKAVTYNHLYRW